MAAVFFSFLVTVELLSVVVVIKSLGTKSNKLVRRDS